MMFTWQAGRRYGVMETTPLVWQWGVFSGFSVGGATFEKWRRLALKINQGGL